MIAKTYNDILETVGKSDLGNFDLSDLSSSFLPTNDNVIKGFHAIRKIVPQVVRLPLLINSRFVGIGKNSFIGLDTKSNSKDGFPMLEIFKSNSKAVKFNPNQKDASLYLKIVSRMSYNFITSFFNLNLTEEGKRLFSPEIACPEVAYNHSLRMVEILTPDYFIINDWLKAEAEGRSAKYLDTVIATMNNQGITARSIIEVYNNEILNHSLFVNRAVLRDIDIRSTTYADFKSRKGLTDFVPLALYHEEDNPDKGFNITSGSFDSSIFNPHSKRFFRILNTLYSNIVERIYEPDYDRIHNAVSEYLNTSRITGINPNEIVTPESLSEFRDSIEEVEVSIVGGSKKTIAFTTKKELYKFLPILVDTVNNDMLFISSMLSFIFFKSKSNQLLSDQFFTDVNGVAKQPLRRKE